MAVSDAEGFGSVGYKIDGAGNGRDRVLLPGKGFGKRNGLIQIFFCYPVPCGGVHAPDAFASQGQGFKF